MGEGGGEGSHTASHITPLPWRRRVAIGLKRVIERTTAMLTRPTHCRSRRRARSRRPTTPTARGDCRGPSSCDGRSSAESTAARTKDVTGPVRITHPFHPLIGQELDFVELRSQWGEDRVFCDRGGHLTSLPARWTSAVPEDPGVAAGAGRSPFRAQDLLELAALLSDLKP